MTFYEFIGYLLWFLDEKPEYMKITESVMDYKEVMVDTNNYSKISTQLHLSYAYGLLYGKFYKESNWLELAKEFDKKNNFAFMCQKFCYREYEEFEKLFRYEFSNKEQICNHIGDFTFYNKGIALPVFNVASQYELPQILFKFQYFLNNRQ